MLKKFEVKGYKNFKENIVFDLSRIKDYHFNNESIYNGIVNTAIIYGQNTVGKTNFGKAILDIKSNLTNDSLMHSMDSNYLNADMNEKSAQFTYEFQFNKVNILYRYRKSNETILDFEELYIDGDTIFIYDHVQNKMIDHDLKKINADTLNWEFIENTPSIFSYIANNVSLQNESPIRQLFNFIKGMRLIRGNMLSSKSIDSNRIVADIIKQNKVKDFERFLNRFNINEKLKVIDSVTGTKMLCFDYKQPILFLDNCSSGTASMLQLYSWVRSLENATFLYIDSFDAFYHYELSCKVIEMFKEITSCQTVVTSYNTDLLTNKIMRPDCFFILATNRIVSLPDATSRELKENHNLKKLNVSREFND